jgi:hypothetical protein
MIKRVCLLSIASLLVFASLGYAQYTMELTGVGDGATSGDVYVSPYNGSIWSGAYTGGSAPTSSPLYNGYVICDDFTDEASLLSPWNVTATNANDVTPTGPNQDVLFAQGYNPFTVTDTSYTAQQAYDAVAWLATQLVEDPNVNNPSSNDQTNYSFAIWDIMDNQKTDPDGGAQALITAAFNAVINQDYVPGMNGALNVTVYTPDPIQNPGPQVSQEFLVVSTPEASTPLLLAVDLLGFIALVGFLRKRISRAI